MKINSHQSSLTSHQKKIFLFILSFLSVTSMSCVKKEIKNIDAQGKNIICLGDSLTFGYGVGKKEDYPAALAKISAMPVINAGIDGDTSSEALNRLDTDVLDRDPLLVVIEFGGNDFLRKIPLQVTEENIKKMVARIQERGAMVAITDISTDMIMNGYRKMFYKICQDTGSIFIYNLLSGIITNPHLKSDFLHPNRQGYAIIAGRVYRAIRPYLKTKQK